MEEQMKNIMDKMIFENSTKSCENEMLYQNMYQVLFREVSKVLTLLKENNSDFSEKAIQILEHAQCKVEEIFVNAEQPKDNRIELELKEKLYKMLDEKDAEDLYETIMEYNLANEKTQFSLGMKEGAKLILLLTSE